MKISNSKKQLAQIIHENGGWRGGAEWAAQDKNPLEVGFWLASKKPNREPWPGGIWVGDGWSGSSNSIKCAGVQLVENWHQTVLSRDEYFHLYPAPVEVVVENKTACHLTVTDKPTLEQLAADYRNHKDYADRKQQEADAAKADAEAKLADLVVAGKALGLVLGVAEPEPELVINDWRDLQVGDEIEVFNFECPEDASRRKQELMSGPCIVMQTEGGNVRIELKDNLPKRGPYWNATGVDACDFKFIRRPAKGGADA